ncbi:MAG: metallophosphoesterase [Tyzzerella sp.]|nr:metallophosphoesterase [Tyzzerella sp.]
MLKWIILFAVLCVLAVIEWMREIHSFRLTRYKVTSKKLNGLGRERKVMLLSDLHNYSYGEKNEKLLRVISGERPDMILVAGDMLVGKKGEPTAVAEEFMTKLPEISETYYGNGNHEQRMKEGSEESMHVYQSYKEKLTASGVHFLENQKTALSWDGIDVEIYGLEIPREKYKKFCKNHYGLQNMTAQIGSADSSKYTILIAHNPIFMQTYFEWGADLIVSGHLHGGIVRLPFIGGVITPQFTLFPKYSGEMRKNIEKDATAVVSKGIGIHTIKVRLFNPAEVVVMHINGTEE